MDIQKRIRELMEERGWSDYRLAKEANLSHSTIANIFHRNNAPTFPTLETVCNALGITLAQFFLEGDDPIVLNEEQKLLLTKWCALTDEQKKVVFDLLDILR